MIPRQVVFLLLLALPRLALAQQTIAVDTAIDELNNVPLIGSCPGTDKGCSLREAVNVFNGGGNACGCTKVANGGTSNIISIMVPTVTLSLADPAPGTTDNSNQTGDLDVFPSADLIIQSGIASTNNVVVDAAGIDRAFDVHSRGGGNNITFSGIDIIDGTPVGGSDECFAADAADGGGVRIDYLGAFCGGPGGADNVTFNGSSVGTANPGGIGNSAAGNGGGIATQGAALFLDGSTVANNHSIIGSGGGIFATAGIVAVQQASLVDHNQADGGSGGGGIFVSSPEQSTTATDCLASGAAALTQALCVNASTVSNNTSSNLGGGVESLSGAAIFDTAKVTNNHAINGGGGIYAGSVVAVQQSSQIDNNHVTTGSGGGIDTIGTGESISGLDCIANGAAGGAVTLALCVDTSTVSSNVAGNSGGGVATQIGAAIFNHATLASDSATNNGGGIFSTSGIVAFQRSSTLTNASAKAGGGIYTTSIDASTTGVPLDCAGKNISLCVNNATIDGSQASAGNGGGIALVPGAGNQTTTINKGTIGSLGAANTASGNGGGVFAGACNGTCTLTINNATSIDHNQAGGDGGGIDNLDFNLSSTASTISNNTAGGRGGGIANFSNSPQALTIGAAALGLAADCSTVASQIIANTATGNGGGIFFQSPNGSAHMTINNTCVGNLNTGGAAEGNSALNGGGIYLDNCSAPDCVTTITDSFVQSNQATTDGAGIALESSGAVVAAGAKQASLTIDTSEVSHNMASGRGGGLFNDVTVSAAHTLIKSSRFLANTATLDGGAIYNQADGSTGFTFAAGNPTPNPCPAGGNIFALCNSKIGAPTQGNSAANGGGIATNSSLWISGSSIFDNSASTGNGGGASVTSSGTLFAADVAWRGNASVAGNGGALASTGTTLLFGNELSSNTASAGNGGAIASDLAAANQTQALIVLYSTLSGNTASAGGGVFVDPTQNGNALLNNVTVSGNTAGTGTGGVFGGSNTSIANSIVDLNTSGGAASDCAGAAANAPLSQGDNVFGLGSGCATGTGDVTANNTGLALITTLGDFGGTAALPSGGDTNVLAIGPGSDALNTAGIVGTACGAIFSATGNFAGLGFVINPPATDQRGVAQPQPAAGRCDRGAFESTPDNTFALTNINRAPVAGGADVTSTINLLDHGQATSAIVGADEARNLVATFTLPPHTIFRSITPPATGTWVCTNPSSGTDSGATALVFTCSQTVAGTWVKATTGNFTLIAAPDAFFTPNTDWNWTASIADQTADPHNADNLVTCNAATASGTVPPLTGKCTVTGSAVLAITKTDGVASISAGSAPVYTVTVSNSGPSAGIGATVTDAVPTTTPPGAIASFAWTCSATAPSTCGSATGTGAINSTVTVAPGNPVTFAVTVTTTLNITGTLSNTAAVATPAAYGGGTISATDNDAVTFAVSDLGVSENVPSSVGAGGVLTLVATLTVAGPSSTQNISFTDNSGSTATTFQSYTLDPATAALFQCSGAPVPGTAGASTITCATASNVNVPVGTYTFTTKVVVADPTALPAPIPYSLQVTPSAPPTSPAESASGTGTGTLADTASGSVSVATISDAAIAINAPSTATAGATFTDTVTISNAGPSSAHGLTWNMTTPAGATFVSITPPDNWTCSAPAAGQSGAISCSIAALAGTDDPQPFSIVLSVDPTTADGTLILSSATLAAVAGDPTLANNGPVSASTVVGDSADLQITFVADVTTAPPGGAFTYAIDISNQGPSSANSVTVTIALPAGVVAGTVSSTGLTCGAPAADNVVTCNMATLTSGESETATIAATVSQKAVVGSTLSATAAIGSVTSDPNPANDSAQASVTVTEGTSGNIAFGGGESVSAKDVRARGGFFSCNSGGASDGFDVSALLALGLAVLRYRRRR